MKIDEQIFKKRLDSIIANLEITGGDYEITPINYLYKIPDGNIWHDYRTLIRFNRAVKQYWFEAYYKQNTNPEYNKLLSEDETLNLLAQKMLYDYEKTCEFLKTYLKKGL